MRTFHSYELLSKLNQHEKADAFETLYTRFVTLTQVFHNSRLNTLSNGNVIRGSIRSMRSLFLLISNSSSGAFSGSSIGLSLLTTNRKSLSMTDTSIASNFLQSLDIKSDFSS